MTVDVASREDPDEVRPGHEGPLAEFVALRQELEGLASQHQNTFTFQLTAVGAVSGFALANPTRTLLVLILPMISYVLSVRVAMLRYGVHDIARYIREELASKVPGGLPYESWYAQNRSHPRFMRYGPASLVAFPGAAAVGLLWALPEILGLFHKSVLLASGVGLIWLAGALLTVASSWIVRQLPHY